MDERLIELEMKLSFQDEAIRKLTDAVERQQKQLYRMEKEIERLRAGMSALESSPGDGPDNAPPPHY